MTLLSLPFLLDVVYVQPPQVYCSVGVVCRMMCRSRNAVALASSLLLHRALLLAESIGSLILQLGVENISLAD